ncbi:MAG: hypothetical protein IIC69_02690 [Nanoarchaeota archaeon]|nr:hypothetical protein [Nanoarchaeota archaeon]
MNIAIISSTKDKASTNIKENLVDNFDFKESEEKFDDNNIYEYKINNTRENQKFSVSQKSSISENKIKLYTIDSELIFTDDLDKKIDADLFVFISKHKAEEGRASLTCHAIGNFGKAEKGGKERALCTNNSIFLKNIFIELNNNVKEPYEVTLEATHHGPFMEKPLLFVELGSKEKYWEDKKGSYIVAKSVIGAIKKYNDNSSTIIENPIDNENNIDNETYESIFVIGGGHYNHYANKAMLETNLAVGHICAKYNLENLDEKLLKEAMEKIIPKPKFVLLDWKGLGNEKQRILDLLEKNNIEFKRSDKVF